MTWIDVHVAHDAGDFVDDGCARRFDAEHAVAFEDRVGLAVDALETRGTHDLPQAVAFDEESDFLFCVVRLFDDGTGRVGIAADRDFREGALEELDAREVRIVSKGLLAGTSCCGLSSFGGSIAARAGQVRHVNPQVQVVEFNRATFRANLELLVAKNSLLEVIGGQIETEGVDSVQINTHIQVATIVVPDVFNVEDDVFEESLLDTTLDNTRG